MTEQADLVANRPAVLLTFEREEAERQAAYDAEHPFGSPDPPEAVFEAHCEQDRRAFEAMYDQLTPEERAAEAARLRAAATAAEPIEGALSTMERHQANTWDSGVACWCSTRSKERFNTERQATELAESALERCSYLGGFLGHPRRVDFCSGEFSVGIKANIGWMDRRGNPVCWVDWPEILEFRVGATDRGSERFTASRLALVGPFALAFKKQRREAMLAVKTTSGEGMFIVHGHTPIELEAQLAPLSACIGVPPSDAYMSVDSGLWSLAFPLGSPLR
jgi:hypothetical protein